MGRTPLACELFSCPPVRPKKEPGNSDKVIQDVLYRESYQSEAQGRGVTPYPTGRWQAGGSSSLSYQGGEGGYHLQGE